jgi:hypothetical protein
MAHPDANTNWIAIAKVVRRILMFCQKVNQVEARSAWRGHKGNTRLNDFAHPQSHPHPDPGERHRSLHRCPLTVLLELRTSEVRHANSGPSHGGTVPQTGIASAQVRASRWSVRWPSSCQSSGRRDPTTGAMQGAIACRDVPGASTHHRCYLVPRSVRGTSRVNVHPRRTRLTGRA